ncbi:SGNH/GDSL hydrolase family protein [Bacillus sp. B1-b2]|uniref:SGNH/GDSL hydrolase family protein n=1 Tax=Bacillus sp. B1-b2 TaxID=2653201 RepID=UPI0012616AAD|nr:SGNH/GDSL hydrolase family protein [Bacillus sp. B1-b2]KAB7673031.1 SGNH/GDSL hydrolase family protein [Bacillus sp. B1-b2]
MRKLLYSLISIGIIIGSYCIFLFNQQNRNFYEKIQAGRNVNYLIVGDSIGRSSGASSDENKWFQLMEDYFSYHYNSKLKRHLVVQSGATAFEGLYKLKNQDIQQMDLIFIVFGENDRKYMNAEEFYFFYHSLLEELLLLNPNAELITITESSLDNHEFISVIQELSKKFYATNIDMRIPFQHSGLSNNQLTNDLVHPNDLGYTLYAKEITEIIEKAISTNKKVLSPTIPAEEMNVLSMFTKKKVTYLDHSFTKDEAYYTTNEMAAKIEFEFKGAFLGVNVIRSPQGGMMDVFIDEEYVTTISTWWPFAKNRSLYVASGLSKGDHTVTFQVSSKKSKYNVSDKNIIQLSSIIVNKEDS